jgi:hypothetical protein
MQQIPPTPPGKKRGGRPTPADATASLFSTGNHPVVQPGVGDPRAVARRRERGARIAREMKRAIFFTVVLVFVGIVLYQFVSATLL